MLKRGKGAPPLYYQLMEELKEQIENEEYKQGDVFPTEKQLQERYQVSRITVRQAVNELVNAGYLESARGVGTTVVFNKIDETLKQVKSFSEEMESHGIIMKTSHCVISKETTSEEIAKNLGISQGQECYLLERVRCAQDVPIVYSVSYLTGKYKLPLEEARYRDSLYRLLKEEYGIVIARGRDTFEAVPAAEPVGKYLGIGSGAPVFKRTRRTFDQDGDVLEFTVCYYAGDKYKYSVDL